MMMGLVHIHRKTLTVMGIAYLNMTAQVNVVAVQHMITVEIVEAMVLTARTLERLLVLVI